MCRVIIKLSASFEIWRFPELHKYPYRGSSKNIIQSYINVGCLFHRGISSTVRRVTEKTTGVEYAVKIIDISGERGESDQVDQIKRDTFREIRILRMCNGHPNISKKLWRELPVEYLSRNNKVESVQRIASLGLPRYFVKCAWLLGVFFSPSKLRFQNFIKRLNIVFK